jgi:hypothetical protein
VTRVGTEPISNAGCIEQFLMEGSYNKVWSNRSKVKGEEFLVFYNILIDTIRYDNFWCAISKVLETVELTILDIQT